MLHVPFAGSVVAVFWIVMYWLIHSTVCNFNLMDTLNKWDSMYFVSAEKNSIVKVVY